VVVSSEDANETYGSINGGKISWLAELCLNKDTAPWSYFRRQ
jgi:hypothetical protein